MVVDDVPLREWDCEAGVLLVEAHGVPLVCGAWSRRQGILKLRKEVRTCGSSVSSRRQLFSRFLVVEHRRGSSALLCISSQPREVASEALVEVDLLDDGLEVGILDDVNFLANLLLLVRHLGLLLALKSLHYLELLLLQQVLQ